MISENQTENGSFWEFRGKLDFVDQWFLMSSPVPMVAITISYILFVLKIGPEYMKTRKPFSLKNLIVLYNIGQVFISAYLFYSCTKLMLLNGFVSKTCLLEKEDTRKNLATVMYYYFLAKTSELLDTIFFVLRKKSNQITFLHVYHHAIMILTSWMILKYEPTYPTIFIRNINAFVHIIMYGYYGLSSFPSLSKYLWWKKYITSLQLIQFVLILIHFVMTYTTSECTPSYPLCLTITINATLFLFLFGKFYLSTYNTNDGKNRNLNATKEGDDQTNNGDEISLNGKSSCKGDDGINNDIGLLRRKKLMNGNR